MNQALLVIPMILGYSTPLILAALGGLFSERSGIVNIALEGIMMVGGFVAATATYFLEPIMPGAAAWVGILLGTLAGVAFSSLHAVASINLKADQVISGTALNILAGGLTVFLCQVIFNQMRTATFKTGMARIDVPFLSSLPILGPALFTSVAPTFYVAVLLVALSWFVIYRTPFGLRMRSCGEHPQAAASLGINVPAMRYAGVLISGGLAGMAGGTMVLTADMQFTGNSIHGSGFIALACLIFGKWKPWGLFAAGLFFGASQVLSLYVKEIPHMGSVSVEIFKIIPYALTLFALLFFAGKSVGPRAEGEIYDPGKR